MAEGHQRRSKLDEGLRIHVQRHPVVAKGEAERAQGHAAGVVCGGILLQVIHGPKIIEDVANNVHVGSTKPVSGHLSAFVFLSYLRKE